MRRLLLLAGLVCTMMTALFARQNGPAPGLNADTLSALEFRNLGPTLHTGRIQDVAIDPKNPSVWYVASAFGGVWKT